MTGPTAVTEEIAPCTVRWFGVLADTGYPAFALFLVLLLSSMWSCRRVRRMAKRGRNPGESRSLRHRPRVGPGGVHRRRHFVPFHYVEMLWHFLALTMALENVAAAQAALISEQRTREAKPPIVEKPVEEEFVWA